MNKILVIMTSLTILTISSAFAGDEKVKALMFHEADSILAVSHDVQADLLAPKSTKKAIELYSEASSDYDKGKDINSIKKKLKETVRYLGKSMDAVDMANVTFKDMLTLRTNALRADAHENASDSWQKAEKKFEEAAIQLEEGDVNDAKKKADEASNIYRQAELTAIKTNYLDNTRDLLTKAEDSDVKDKAPVTLTKAKDLVSRAETSLNNNRYDADEPRGLALGAQYEAKHALYLNKAIRQIEKDDKELEDLYLSFEEYLRQIAVNLDLSSEFDEGFGKPTNMIIEHTKALQDSTLLLNQSLADSEMDMLTMTARITELEDQLGNAGKERTALTDQLERRSQIREMFNDIERRFHSEQAIVLRHGDDIVIRLVGLSFASGKSEIEPKNFALLTIVRDAINIFPDYALHIQGYTDSYGGDNTNLELSQNRADAVRDYLLANMAIGKSDIDAVGYGETLPIANNETPEGRARNRRVDLVIQPIL
ncbi:MAG: OmpA family protein [bacterium]|nr:OmpA family protein [bacterium]